MYSRESNEEDRLFISIHVHVCVSSSTMHASSQQAFGSTVLMKYFMTISLIGHSVCNYTCSYTHNDLSTCTEWSNSPPIVYVHVQSLLPVGITGHLRNCCMYHIAYWTPSCLQFSHG